MNYLLSQIILAARRRGTEGWTNILFIVVLAVFWVIGGILKARANKSKQKGEEQLARKPGLKPPDRARVPRRKLEPPRRKIARPQPVVQKFATKKEQAIPLGTIELLEEPKLSVPTPQVQPELPELQKLPEFTTKAVEGLEAMRVRTPAEIPRAKYLAEILLDYSDPDDLKRAILHYEILGRPLSLRDPSQHIIGL